MSPESAWQLGLSYVARIDDVDSRVSSDASASLYARHGDAWRFGFDASFLYVYYPSPDNAVTTYFTFGPRGGQAASESITRNMSPSISEPRGYRECSWNVGLTGGLGVECFPTRQIGLLAEYRTSFLYGSSKSWYFVEIDGKPHRYGPLHARRTTALGADAVRFGLSLYF